MDELITKVLEHFYRRRNAQKGTTYESVPASVIKYSDSKYGDVKRKIIEYEQLLDEVNLSSDVHQHYRINKKGVDIIEKFGGWIFYKNFELFDKLVTNEYSSVSNIFDEIGFDKKYLEQFVNNTFIKIHYDFINDGFGDPYYQVRLKQKQQFVLNQKIDNSKHTYGDQSPIVDGGSTLSYGDKKSEDGSIKRIIIGIIIGLSVIAISYVIKEIYSRITIQQQQEQIQADSLRVHK